VGPSVPAVGFTFVTDFGVVNGQEETLGVGFHVASPENNLGGDIFTIGGIVSLEDGSVSYDYSGIGCSFSGNLGGEQNGVACRFSPVSSGGSGTEIGLQAYQCPQCAVRVDDFSTLFITTPEPATGGLMLLGFGMMMRKLYTQRRQRARQTNHS
jgi:PEP-CTERM motif